ncbi:cation diffusion facilitator family transporter [Alteribacillus sp. YIM 98480]|uniref:cation diffusion facilitator family transporter n=1 Tax=Alteribacillus sp. YIM 98480 TaxID=2606599 RepID=UPI00131A76FB|nr:cation diffusion facilitator family transporter [Alteribacillus sp. YIM 98480]
MDHNHGHSHHANKKALLISFILISLFMIIEVIGGVLTNSLALLSDAGHMLSDAAALGLSLLAFKLGEKKADAAKTFGYKRFEILAAFLNGITLMVISAYIFYEAFHRFAAPPKVASFGMLTIASLGFFINIIMAFILMRGDTSDNLNLRSAFLHVLGDLLGSVGAIIAALLILVFDWGIADPIASVIVAVLILISGWRVTRDSVHVLMEGHPAHVKISEVRDCLKNFNGVVNIHDLHIWTITSDFPALTCHLVVNDDVDRDQLLQNVTDRLREEFGIHHTTIQLEGPAMIHRHDDTCN